MSIQNNRSKNFSAKSTPGSSSIMRSNGITVTRLPSIKHDRIPTTRPSDTRQIKPKTNNNLSKDIDMIKTTIDATKTRLLNTSIQSNEDLQKKYAEAMDKINQLESENNILRRKLEVFLSQTNEKLTIEILGGTR